MVTGEGGFSGLFAGFFPKAQCNGAPLLEAAIFTPCQHSPAPFYACVQQFAALFACGLFPRAFVSFLFFSLRKGRRRQKKTPQGLLATIYLLCQTKQKKSNNSKPLLGRGVLIRLFVAFCLVQETVLQPVEFPPRARPRLAGRQEPVAVLAAGAPRQ